MRLVILGGSGSSTPEFADALATWPGGLDRRPELDITLVGRSRDKLDLVAVEFRRRAGPAGPRLAVAVSTDRRRALEGADVVLNQVRVGGLDARTFDETFPREVGIPGEETMGPGGFANALRTVPALRDTWADIAELAPTAFIVNLTNPAGIVDQAARSGWPQLAIVTVCDAPVAFAARVAERLGRPIERVLRRYVGMNHCGFYLPEQSEELRSIAELASGFDRELVEVIGALPTPYVRYYLDPRAQLEAQLGKAPRADELKSIDAALLSAYAAGPTTERRKRGAVWYELVVVPLLDGWVTGSERPLVLGTPNGSSIPEAPPTTMIEVAIRVSPGRLEPLPVPAIPPAVAIWLARHGAYEALAVAATVPGTGRTERLRALLANPMVASLAQARRLLAAIESDDQRMGGISS
jgi:6-phospho-beta-glucosidase